MPIIETSSFIPQARFHQPHLQTWAGYALRPAFKPRFERKQIVTADGDLLLLDWSRVGAKRLAIITHGLEGSSQSAYVLRMTSTLNQEKWDVMAWNLRGCGGTPNCLARWYHAGDSDDLRRVFSHALFRKRYSEIILIGFSLGGNITLKFLGEAGSNVSALIKQAVVFSVPCDLASATTALAKPSNRLYQWHFFRNFKKKIEAKRKRFPKALADWNFSGVKNFKDLDERYTAPLGGFKSAEDYWQRCSSRPLLGAIAVPTLLVNAQDDPFLGPECYPHKEAELNPHLYLETPAYGGHNGFVDYRSGFHFWGPKRTLEFLADQSSLSVEADPSLVANS